MAKRKVVQWEKGQIVWLNLGNQSEGHEQQGTRPAIVITYIPALELAIVIPITSQDSGPKTITSHLLSSKIKGRSQRDKSWALVHQIRAISTHRITGQAGRLQEEDVFAIDLLLKQLLLLS